MSPTDWETIKQIFSAVLTVPASGRDEYLDHACGGRDDIRNAVDELLRAHYEASGSFLEPNTIVVRAAWLFQANDTVAGRFRVVKPIARGAMGEVYRVYDERLRLHVALKAIRPELLGDVDTVERFRREVSVTRNIAHDGLCRVFDLVEHPLPSGLGFPEGTIVPCLTMQMLEGESLEEWLAAHRPVATDDALPLVRQIAEALQVLHDAGVVHRDLKPSNVMLVPSDNGLRAVLTDFGLAKPLEEGLFETQGSAHGGAPFFMAPELFRGERPSVASDIYALGLLIDEMVTKTRAFSASSLHGLLLDKLGEGPTPPSERAEALPKVWEATILRCLSPEPASRFASAAAVMSSLAGHREPLWRRPLVRRTTQPYGRSGMRLAAYIVAAAVALTGAVSISTPASSPTSVVILPFDNLTGDSENQYLAVGTVGELGRVLNRVPGWSVYTARDPDTPIDPSRRATFSLRGHVQQGGSTLRITVQLTDTARGTLLWSENFEGSRTHSLDLQEKLAADTQVALKREAGKRAAGPMRSLRSWLRVDELFPRRAPLTGIGTSKPEAYDLYLRARYVAEDRTLDSALTAISLYRRAIDIDPNFAAAFTGLADVQAVLMDLHHAPHAQLISDADRYASAAVAIDPDLPEAQLSLAAVRQMQSRWEEAETAYRRALELHPTFARAHRWFGGMLLQFGRFKESLSLFKKALDLDPYDFPSHSAYGLALFYAKQPLEAAAHLEGLIARKDHVHAHLLLGQVYAQLSAIEPSARQEYLQKALQQSAILRQYGKPAEDRYADLVAALAWSYRGDREAARDPLQRLEAGWASGATSPSFAARIYAVQARAGDALAALEAAEAQRDRELMYLNVSPLYDAIRSEPRFRALQTRVGLTQ